MSINITVNGGATYEYSKRKILQDPTVLKKEQFDRNRKLRLAQVRQKSKELASKIRKDVATEKEKQLKRIEQIKRCELEKWREKALSENKKIYENCLLEVGTAHKAAQSEEQDRKCSPRSKKTTRGGSFKYSVKPRSVSTGFDERPSGRKQVAGNIMKRPQQDCEKARQEIPPSDKAKHDNVKDQVKKSGHTTHLFPNIDVISCMEDSISSYEGKLEESHRYSPKKKAEINLSRTSPIIFQIDSDDNSSILSIEDMHAKSNTLFAQTSFRKPHEMDISKSPTKARDKETCKEDEFNTKKYDGEDLGLSSEEKEGERKLYYTEISELIRNMNNNIMKTQNDFTDDAIDRLTETLSDVKKTKSVNGQVHHDDYVHSKFISNRKLMSPKKKPYDRSSELLGQNLGNMECRRSFTDTTTTNSKLISLKSSSKTSSNKTSSATSSSMNRVQLYDYPNKFHKQYDQPESIVLREREQEDKPNAKEQAKLEMRVEELREQSARELRNKSELRSKAALEKEQIKKDYESLTAKLDALSKEKDISHGISHADPNILCENRLDQFMSDRQRKMNTAVESILQRPILITCPEVKDPPKFAFQDIRAKKKFDKDALNVGSKQNIDTNDDNLSFLNSSDSCASILLNYVDGQKMKISKDIGECSNELKKEKLNTLLERINRLREHLISQIKVYDDQQTNKDLNDMLLNSIQNLEKERKNILLDNKESANDMRNRDFEKRERRLKRKEEMLDNKLQELALLKAQSAEKVPEPKLTKVPEPEHDEERIVVIGNDVRATKPVKIIIKLTDEQRKEKKSPFKSPRKVSSLIQQPVKRKRKSTQTSENDMDEDKIFLQETKQATPKKSTKKFLPTSESTSSTLYRSPPETMQTRFGKMLDEAEKEAIPSERLKTSTLKLNEKLNNSKKEKLNPVLKSYIQRLLGMTSASVEMLGVSSSEIQTPSSSLINISGNISIRTDNESLESGKIERLKKFIDDNYNFLDEVEESLKSEKSITDSSKSDVKSDAVWKNKFVEIDKKSNKEHKEERTKEIRSILKKREKPPPVENKEKQVEQKQDENNVKEFDKIDLVNKYTELTDNCTQRIAELTEMINKVRQEKQRILEITLSSNSDTGRNSTEYMEFADRHISQASQNSSKISDDKSMISARDLENVQLEKNKLTGVSRDSGISMSRPVTALDTHDSSEIQTSDKSPIHDKNKEIFIPILKDIPKYPVQIQQISTLTKNLSIAVDVEASIKTKKPRPPVSLSRFSPQIEEDVPHELSTILEVDTPATSRINTSVVDKDVKQPEKIVVNEKSDTQYTKFLTFEEYAKQHNLDLTKLDLDSSSKLPIDIEELITLSQKNMSLEYQQFPSPRSYMKENGESIHETLKNLAESLEKIQINYKEFPNHKKYAEEAGHTSLLDTKSIEDSTECQTSKILDVVEKSSSSKSSIKKDESSDGSLPNIVAELEKRNILLHPFEIDPREKLDFSQLSDSKSMKNDLEKSTKLTSVVDPPVRDDNRETIQKSPEQTNSNDIENDLNKMGLTWAALMLKKSQQSQALSSSSTSSIAYSSNKFLAQKILKDSVKNISVFSSNDSSSIDSGGKPLNLKDFLTKELQRRTNMSSSSGDDSLASQFLRSLLNSTLSTPKINGKANQERLRTSTPVVTGTSSSQGKSPADLSNDLFSGESRLSSVKFNSHSSKSSNGDNFTTNESKNIPSSSNNK